MTGFLRRHPFIQRHWSKPLQLFVIVAMVVVMAWVIEGRMHLLLGLAVMATAGVVAHQHRALVLRFATGLAALSTFVLFVMTAGCKMAACFTAIDGYPSGWKVFASSSAEVRSVCVDDICAFQSTILVPLWKQASVAPSKPLVQEVVGTYVHVSDPNSREPRSFLVRGDFWKDRSYNLTLTMNDGRVVTQKVRPRKSYCNGRRCSDAQLTFHFSVDA
jgi:hypothetical protein